MFVPATAHDRRRARGAPDQDHAAHQAGQWLDALERANGGCRDWHLQDQLAALFPALRPAAAPERELQAVQRPVVVFIEKLRDVVGLYLSPPDNALVICVDKKSQCQALERTQPRRCGTGSARRPSASARRSN